MCGIGSCLSLSILPHYDLCRSYLGVCPRAVNDAIQTKCEVGG